MADGNSQARTRAISSAVRTGGRIAGGDGRGRRCLPLALRSCIVAVIVTFLDERFGIGKYQTIVAGVLLTITAIANPDGVMSTSTGKGPAVAFFKARDHLLARVGVSREPRRTLAGPDGSMSPGAGSEREPAIAEVSAAPKTPRHV